MKTQLPISLAVISDPLSQYGVQFREYDGQIATGPLSGAVFETTTGSTGTALQRAQFDSPKGGYYLPINTRTENQVHADLLFREKIFGQSNRGILKMMPVLSLTALMACPSYQLESFDSTVVPIRAWVDRSSEATWGLANEAETLQAATAGTSLELHIASLAARGNSAKTAVAAIEEQPRFDYREVLAYARNMGLPTEFPL